jgi:hypothetical protein
VGGGSCFCPVRAGFFPPPVVPFLCMPFAVVLFLVPVLGLIPGPLHLPAPPRHCLRPGRRCAAPRSELGFQVDPSATASSVLVLSSFAALQLKINQAQAYRETRDAALEAFRLAQVKQLDGKLAAEEV